MHKKPLISRLAEIYEDQKYTYFVTDGEGNCMAKGMTEIDARIHSMKDPNWSIGREESLSPVTDYEPNEDLPFYNDDGTAITYENKDILNEEDFDAM